MLSLYTDKYFFYLSLLMLAGTARPGADTAVVKLLAHLNQCLSGL